MPRITLTNIHCVDVTDGFGDDLILINYDDGSSAGRFWSGEMEDGQHRFLNVQRPFSSSIEVSVYEADFSGQQYHLGSFQATDRDVGAGRKIFHITEHGSFYRLHWEVD